MAKRKGKVELIEETLDAEIEVEEQESPQAPATKSSNHSHSRPTTPQDKDDTLAARSQRTEERTEERAEERTEERTKETTEDREHYKISFVWRRYVENRFPETLLWVDRLAQDWRSGGNFEFIDISHPVAKEAVISGLKNIREVNKKLAPYALLARQRVERVLQQWTR
jgi:hypothetical protein